MSIQVHAGHPSRPSDPSVYPFSQVDIHCIVAGHLLTRLLTPVDTGAVVGLTTRGCTLVTENNKIKKRVTCGRTCLSLLMFPLLMLLLLMVLYFVVVGFVVVVVVVYSFDVVVVVHDDDVVAVVYSFTVVVVIVHDDVDVVVVVVVVKYVLRFDVLLYITTGTKVCLI